jgi:pentatricopeptide repeat protein
MREMRKHGGVDPDYATVISGWCKFRLIEDAAKVFDDMLARAVLKNVKVLLLNEASRVQDAVGWMLRWCAGQRCIGDATRRGDGPAGGYAGVPTVFLQHTRVSRGGLAVSRKTLRFAEKSA